MTLILSNEEIQRALRTGDCLEVMEEAYRELAQGRAVSRQTTHCYLPHSLPESSYSFKSVDGGVKKFGVLALRLTSDIGSGGQARAHFRFLAAIRPLKRVKIYSPNLNHREAFAAEMRRESGIFTEAVPSAEQAVKGCDIVCTATNSSRPVIEAAWLKPGMHYNAIREFEMDEAALEKSDVVAIHTRFGGIEHFQPPGTDKDLPGVRREKERDWSRYPEICELIDGRSSGRANDRQITFFFNNIGTAVQFAALGYLAYRAAREKGLGKEIPTEWFLQDIKP